MIYRYVYRAVSLQVPFLRQYLTAPSANNMNEIRASNLDLGKANIVDRLIASAGAILNTEQRLAARNILLSPGKHAFLYQSPAGCGKTLGSVFMMKLVSIFYAIPAASAK